MDVATRITDAHIEQYSSDGVTVVRNAIGMEWIENLVAGIEENIQSPSDRGRFWNRDDEGHTTFFDAQVWRTNNHYKDFVLHSPMAELAGRVMGVPAVNFFYDAIFVRSRGTQFRTPFHQDEPYWSVEGFDCSSAWMPLMSCEKRSALEFVRGSHRWPQKFAQTNFGALTGDDRDQVHFDQGETVPFPDIEGERDQFEILSWAMEPGDVAIFNARTIHGGSGLLRGDRELRVFNSQWLGPDVRINFRPEGMDPDHSQVMTEAGLGPGDRVAGPLYPEVWHQGLGANR